MTESGTKSSDQMIGSFFAPFFSQVSADEILFAMQEDLICCKL